MSNEWTYDVNDLVWAKMKGFPPWPGRVAEPTDVMKKITKKNCKCIFFFGSENYAWIEVVCLKPYYQYKDTLSFSCKTQSFKEACVAIEEYIKITGQEIKNNGTTETDPRFDSLVVNNVAATTPPVKKKMSIPRASNSSSVKKRKPDESSTSHTNDSKNKPKKSRLNNTDILTNLGLTNSVSSPTRRNNTTLLDRPEVQAPETTPVDIKTISKSLLNKGIAASSLKFGFIGLGNIGSGIVKNLLQSGHKVTIWNRTPVKSEKFEEAGAIVGLTPSDVVGASDITFSCVADPQVAKDMVFGNCGVLTEITKGKGFVEMSGIDPDTSTDIGEAIISKGGRYLETMIQGSKMQAENGNLICLAAGDKTLFDDCKTSFMAIAKHAIFLGEIGTATKMNLILNLIHAVSLAGLAEAMALADRASIDQKVLLTLLGMSESNSPILVQKGEAMMNNNFQTNQALKLIQKDLNMTINWSDTLEQPCPVTASVNEVFKHAKRLGYSDHDTSAVYVRAKF